MRYLAPPEVKVYGDWMIDGDLQYDAYEAAAAKAAIPARLVDRWNGWAVPALDADGVRALVASQAALGAEDDRLEFDGEVLTVLPPDHMRPEVEDQRITADDFDGTPRWTLDIGWTFVTVDFDDPASPTKEQKEAFDTLRANLAPSERLISTFGRVLADGSHEFDICTEVPDGSPRALRLVKVRTVDIDREGKVTVVLDSLPLSQRQAIEAQIARYDDEDTACDGLASYSLVPAYVEVDGQTDPRTVAARFVYRAERHSPEEQEALGLEITLFARDGAVLSSQDFG